MVLSEVKMFSVNDSSLYGNILIFHPITYFHLCGKYSDGMEFQVVTLR